MAQASFPEPKDLKVDFKDRVGDGTSYDPRKYTVAHPHPGYGTDPNILNCFGHTKYPMKVYSKIEGKKVIVNNAEEEAQHTANIKPSVPLVANSNSNPPSTPAPVANNPWPTAK